MKKSIPTIAVAAFVASMFAVSAVAVAGEQNEKVTRVSGQVKVAKDDKGAVTGVRIGDDAVVLDDMGEDLATLMDGKRTMAAVVVEEKEGAKTLVLRNFTIINTAGTIKVAKGEGGKVESVSFAADAGPQYTVLMHKKTEKFAEMDGKAVSVSGSVGLKDGAKTLMVQNYQERKAEKKDEAK